jgi:hypothetical protein
MHKETLNPNKLLYRKKDTGKVSYYGETIEQTAVTSDCYVQKYHPATKAYVFSHQTPTSGTLPVGFPS